MRKLLTILAVGTALLVAMPAMAQQEGQQRMGGGRTGEHRGEMLRKMDKNADGAVSKDEFMTAAAERFTKMDRNGDGQLSKEDRPEGGRRGPGGPGGESGDDKAPPPREGGE